MLARLVKDEVGKILLLDANGSISEATESVIANLLTNFKNANSFSGSYGKWSDVYADMKYYPGETLAYVTDSLDLIISNVEPFLPLLAPNIGLHNYISAIEYAKKHNKSHEIIKVFCREGRICGAVKKGRSWIIPEDAPYPVPPKSQKGPHKSY